MLARHDLEKLYECSRQWTTVVEHPLQPRTTDTSSTSNLNKKAGTWDNLARIAYALSCLAKSVTEIMPIVEELADEFARISPMLLEGAMVFLKFVNDMQPLMDKNLKYLKSLVAQQEEGLHLDQKCEDLEWKCEGLERKS